MNNFDCTLDGVALSSLSGRICILDIAEDAPRMHETTLPLHSGGQHVLTRERQSISIRVRFAIHEERPALRSAIAASIRAWAADSGYLTITARPGQRLHVSCTETPAFSGNDWTEELTLVFTSTHTPWWEDAETTSASGTDARIPLSPKVISRGIRKPSCWKPASSRSTGRITISACGTTSSTSCSASARRSLSPGWR